ncbi:HD-GYP domain-containing protein [Phaeacidiphilus oryzae]|uniref:HD-GYP domain-containing protein n=1 Tax=Phaeacidiphilus oryzae TaxID=348818 RepID=UPI000A9CECEE|nr:HD domain-containing phosphohydrolase [Phaeacidiphilus oryzae]
MRPIPPLIARWASLGPVAEAVRRAGRGAPLGGGPLAATLGAAVGAGVYGAAGLAACVSVAVTAWRGLAQPGVALAFGAFVAVGELVRTALPGDREQAPLGSAGALAYALLGPDQGRATSHGVFQVVAVAWVGGLVGLVPHLVRRRLPDPAVHARRLLVVLFIAVLFQPLYDSGTLDALGVRGPLYGLFLAACAALAAICDVLLAAVLRYCRAGCRTAFGRTLRDEVKALLGIGSAIVATGMVMAVAVGEVGLWALPLFSVPLLLTQASFGRYAAVRATQWQTVRSLARASEVAGYTLPGHARRVADLARLTGRELGLGERDLRILEQAALMHDLGQLSLVDAVPGGATVILAEDEQRRIAELGSEVVLRTGASAEIAEVAEIVARQAEPYRPGPHRSAPPLAARIIRAANAFADLTAEEELERGAAVGAAVGTAVGAGGGTGVIGAGGAQERLADRLEVLERLRLRSAREFDPRVVEALARVCTRS